jgi:hypothetical protein
MRIGIEKIIPVISKTDDNTNTKKVILILSIKKD